MNSDDNPPEVEDLDIPEGWIIVDFVKEIHIVPDETLDCFDHDLDFFECYCKPRLVNKATIADGSERAIYMHNILTEVRA